MNWYRQINILFSVPLYVAAFALFCISLYAQSALFVLLTFLLLLVNVIPYFYLTKISENIEMLNPEQKIRVFTGEENMHYIYLQNNGNMPVFNGKFQFGLEKNVWSDDLKNQGGTKMINQFSFRFNLLRKESAVFSIKIKGVKRGVARASAINIIAHDLMGVGTLNLKYDRFFHTEVIVYPELIPVTGLDPLKKFEQGPHPLQFSLFEDITAPVGTREYASGDSFNRIHWKASAKSTSLQTKQFEKTTGMSWTLILNVARNRLDVSVSSEDLERNISCIAYICKYAASRKIPFDIFVNIKVRGKGAIMCLPAGEGREQLAKALEMLARINFNSITVPQETLFAYVDRKMYRQPLIILFNCGKKEEEQRYFRKWQRKGVKLFEAEFRNESAHIVAVSQKRKVIS